MTDNPEQPGADERTSVIPMTGAVDDAQGWFDQRMHDFLQALCWNEQAEPRGAVERRALATAARDMIERVGFANPADTAPGGLHENWPHDSVLQPNQLLANTYQVRAVLARGGIGEIYRARHRDLRTDHAIKILLLSHTLDMTLSAMLMDEARLLQTIRHEGVVGCHGLLRDADGRLLLVMEHIHGSTLSARLRAGPIAEPELGALTRRLLEAVGAVHAAGVVHRDLSPDNIMLKNDDAATPVLIDFGVACGATETEEQRILVDFAGKLSWIAPERVGGETGNADTRSDLYSLGLVLAAAARGHKLDMGSDMESARAARTAIPDLTGIPAPLDHLLARLLAPDPADRPSTAADALALLASPAPSGWDRMRSVLRR